MSFVKIYKKFAKAPNGFRYREILERDAGNGKLRFRVKGREAAGDKVQNFVVYITPGRESTRNPDGSYQHMFSWWRLPSTETMLRDAAIYEQEQATGKQPATALAS